MSNRNWRRRVGRWLDNARDSGAFAASGPLADVDADAIADEIARDWDDAGQRGRLETHTGTSAPERDDLAPLVQQWLDENEVEA